MSRNLIHQYLDQVEQLLGNCSDLYVEQFKATILTSDRANLSLRIRFKVSYLLAVSEILFVQDDRITYLDYRYHFQDGQNRLIFRYDNTPHFPDLPSFPHHKHLSDRVIACQKPALTEVLQEIQEALSSRPSDFNP
jgi:hypothetical protein